MRLKVCTLYQKTLYRTLLTEIKFGVKEQLQEELYRLSQLQKFTTMTSYDQFGLYSDGRKDMNISLENNIRKVIMEEHVNLLKEPGSTYIGHDLQIPGDRKLLKNIS